MFVIKNTEGKFLTFGNQWSSYQTSAMLFTWHVEAKRFMEQFSIQGEIDNAN